MPASSVHLCAAVLVVASVPGCRAAEPTQEQVAFFESRIRPVLVEKCYGCHSNKMKTPLGGLRLDTRESIRKGGDSGAAVTPGEPGQSLLLKAISYEQLNLKMPPAGKLSDQQIADFREWISMGAPDPRVEAAAPTAAKKTIDLAAGRNFWAFRRVQDPPVPEVKQTAWARSPIDRFVLAKLEAQGLQPAPAADKRTLLRRVTFDVTGLPPTPAEIDAFLKDSSPDAFAKVVDRLLASPQYGERWARHWLDLVRYAETNGHEFDNDKLDPWRYRDYVVRALNEDVPYDQFVREQIAGDLIAQKRLSADGGHWESPLGTSYFWFGEVLNSATDSVKSRADEVDNQLDVTAKAFLGLTVACARCHDHKFDPLPTADYYSLAGILHSTTLREAVVDSPARTREIRRLYQKIEDVNAEISALLPLRPVLAGNAERQSPFQQKRRDETFEDFEQLTYQGWVVAGAAFGEGPRHELPPNQKLSAYAGEGIASSFGSGSDRFVGTLTSAKFRMPSRFVHVRVAGTKGDKDLKERGPLRLTLVCDGYKGQHVVPDGSGALTWKSLKMTLEYGRSCYFEIVDRSREGHIVVDQIVLSDSPEPPASGERKEDGPASREDDADALTAEQRTALKSLQERRASLEEQIPPTVFAMLAADESPHDVRVHIRGNHENLGDAAPRRFLRVVAGEQQSPIATGSGRLQLANWIAAPENPLTARVLVNRLWQHHFGKGIVRSPDNFGSMGERPTHPELLDYLASRFVESGWSVKAMHRMMLLSSTYQMASQPDAAAAKADPENRMLHHIPVRRLEAEAVRDAVLAVAGTLDKTLYGPSIPPYISPYQDGRGKPKSGPLDGARRRSIYVQVRRNFLPMLYLAFDYPPPISTIGVRGSSTVPSQALLMMNNEFVAGQARAWAKRMLSEVKEPKRRIEQMYASAYGRLPEASETAALLRFVREQGARYPAGDEREEPVWADLAHVLMNSAEFLYVR